MSTSMLLYFWSTSFLHCCCPQHCVVVATIMLSMTLPLLHLYNDSLCIRVATHGSATASAAFTLQSLSSCCIVLYITLPLLTAALQLSYWEVSNWSPNSLYQARNTLDVETPSVADKCSLSDLCAAATTLCISHCCLTLSSESCAVALFDTPSASVSTDIRQYC